LTEETEATTTKEAGIGLGEMVRGAGTIFGALTNPQRTATILSGYGRVTGTRSEITLGSSRKGIVSPARGGIRKERRGGGITIEGRAGVGGRSRM